MDFKDIHKSVKVQKIVIVILTIAVALIIFELGVVVGYHKAEFGERMGENFNKNFLGPRGGIFKDFSDDGLSPGGHGAVGKIVSFDFPTLVVAGTDNIEKTIHLDDDTEIREYRNEVGTSSLNVGRFIVVLGSPNNHGEVEARLIRLVPDNINKATSTQ